MALTRAMLKSMGLEDDKVNAIIEAHTETVDGLKNEVERYKTDAEKLPEVQRQLKEAKDAAKNSGDYDKLKKEFDDYKADVQKKEARSAKEKALREIAKEAELSEKGIVKALKFTNYDSFELDEDGKVKDAKALLKSLKEEWPEYITKAKKEGADTPTPPGGNGSGGVKTREEIMKIKDTSERQAAWGDYIKAQSEN